MVDYTVPYLDFAQVNGSGPEVELYAMGVSFADGAAKYFAMSKDDNFSPDVGDDLQVTTFSRFTTTRYGRIEAAVCYATGTPIRTNAGDIPVEHLKPGDQVQTRDNGCKDVLWVGKRHVCYQHILLDSHEVIFAGGAQSESLYPGPMAIKGVSRQDRSEIATLFPAPPPLRGGPAHPTSALHAPTYRENCSGRGDWMAD